MKILKNVKNNIGILVIALPFAILFIALLAFLLYPLALAVYYTFQHFNTLFVIGIIWMFAIIFFTFYIKFKKSFYFNPGVRSIYYILLRLFPVYSFVCSAFAFYNLFDIYSDIVSLGFILLLMLILSLNSINTKERIYYITIPHFKFNLFLRPFYKDSNLIIDKEIKTSFTDELVEIADPMSKNGNENFTGKGFFLPFKDWKKELSYYINRANLVFCSIGISEGIMWEMFEHDEIIDKFIFYLDNNTATIKEIVQNVKEYHKNSKVFSVLYKLQSIECERPFYFIIRGNNCFYGVNLSDITSFIEDNVNNLNSFKFECCENIVNINKNKSANIAYLLKDFVRIYSIIFRSSRLNQYIMVLSMILSKLFYTLLLLLCIALILCGILCILSFIYPTIDGIFNLNSAIDEIFNFDMLSTKERLSLGLGEICIGVKLLKWGLE